MIRWEFGDAEDGFAWCGEGRSRGARSDRVLVCGVVDLCTGFPRHGGAKAWHGWGMESIWCDVVKQNDCAATVIVTGHHSPYLRSIEHHLYLLKWERPRRRPPAGRFLLRGHRGTKHANLLEFEFEHIAWLQETLKFDASAECHRAGADEVAWL